MYLEDEMSTKAKESKMEAVRVVMTPLGSAASNVFNMLNMSFFLVFSTEALGLNIIYSLLYNKLKTNTMSQWIRIEEAAEKYNLKEKHFDYVLE